jgi:ribosomal protein S18 acetylase RimI-like enzyme
MAVDPKFRRQGVARRMLAACDAALSSPAAPGPGRSEIWLHVRDGDEAARGLYAGFGYEEVEEAAGGGGLLGFAGFGQPARRARVLMRRRAGGA